MVGVTTTRGTVLKCCSIKKVENHGFKGTCSARTALNNITRVSGKWLDGYTLGSDGTRSVTKAENVKA